MLKILLIFKASNSFCLCTGSDPSRVSSGVPQSQRPRINHNRCGCDLLADLRCVLLLHPVLPPVHHFPEAVSELLHRKSQRPCRAETRLTFVGVSTICISRPSLDYHAWGHFLCPYFNVASVRALTSGKRLTRDLFRASLLGAG